MRDMFEDWSESSKGRSSDQLVDLLLARLSGQTLEEVTAHSGFQGQVREGEREGERCESDWL